MSKRSRPLPSNLQPVSLDAGDLLLALLVSGPLTIGHVKTLLGAVGINAAQRLTKRVNAPVVYRAGCYWHADGFTMAMSALSQGAAKGVR